MRAIAFETAYMLFVWLCAGSLCAWACAGCRWPKSAQGVKKSAVGVAGRAALIRGEKTQRGPLNTACKTVHSLPHLWALIASALHSLASILKFWRAKFQWCRLDFGKVREVVARLLGSVLTWFLVPVGFHAKGRKTRRAVGWTGLKAIVLRLVR